MTAIEGHNGPYTAPVLMPVRRVPVEWIDYNGHMNVAYYTMALDQAIDLFLERELGIGEGHAARAHQGPYALQSHIQYLDEMLEGDSFTVAIRLIDYDVKRMHLFAEVFKGDTLAATCEQMLMNVDLKTRRSAPYADWALQRLSQMLKDHQALDRPKQLGASLGIRRKNTDV